MENSHIQWTDNTQNFWIGCTKVSAGCAHCYAEARDVRFNGGIHWGKGAPRQRTTASNWREPYRWNRAMEGCHYSPTRPEREMCAFGWRPHRARVFCSSLSDIFDAEVPIEWFVEAMNVVRECSNLDWQLLTKRPENFKDRVAGAINNLSQGPATDETFEQITWLQDWQSGNSIPQNIWMGTSVENQECADERIPALLQIPAKIRFLSCEPLLGPVNLAGNGVIVSGIHWVIVGGESGSNARPMAVAWAQSLVSQCKAAGVACFVKQLGAQPFHDFVGYPGSAIDRSLHLKDKKGGDMQEWPEELKVRDFP